MPRFIHISRVFKEVLNEQMHFEQQAGRPPLNWRQPKPPKLAVHRMPADLEAHPQDHRPTPLLDSAVVAILRSHALQQTRTMLDLCLLEMTLVVLDPTAIGLPQIHH